MKSWIAALLPMFFLFCSQTIAKTQTFPIVPPKTESTPYMASPVDSSYSFKWDADTWTWQLVKRSVVLKRYTDGRLAIDRSGRWNPGFEDWTPLTKRYFAAFDNTANAVNTDSTEVWDTATRSWVRATKSTSYQNDNGTLDHLFSYDWDKVRKRWTNTYRIFYTYGDTALHTEGYYRFLNDTAWVGLTNTYNIFDDKGYTKRYLSLKWDKDLKSWKNNTERREVRDTSGLLLYKIVSTWTDSAGQYLPMSKQLYQKANGLSFVIGQVWNVDSVKWLNNSRSYTRKTPQSTISYSEIWDTDTQSWLAVSRQTTYPRNARNQTRIHSQSRTKTDTVWKNKSLLIRTYQGNSQLLMSESYKWDKDRNDWKGRSKVQYFYSLVTSVSPKKTTADAPIKVYPNPARNLLSLPSEVPDGHPVSISDLNGQIYIRIAHDRRIEISDLPPGLYYLILPRKNRTAHIPWIKQ